MKIVKGDIFKSDADAILHQVNCQGVMGSGVAKQVREKYPNVYRIYKDACDLDKITVRRTKSNKSFLLGHILVCPTSKEPNCQLIVNLFAQDKFGYDGKCYTDYDALRKCLETVNIRLRRKKIAIPYLMACHRGGGDWNVVHRMIQETLFNCDVVFYKYSE